MQNRLDMKSVCVFQNVLAKVYKLALSNDGEHFSNEAAMLVYHSKCVACTMNDGGQAQCSLKVKIKIILIS